MVAQPTTSTIPKKLWSKLDSHYNIVGYANYTGFQHNIYYLKQMFAETKKEVYGINDRYIIEHRDNDVYIDSMRVGMFTHNFFDILYEFDIPAYTVLLYTNHFGIQREIDFLCARSHPNDRPTVVESFVTTEVMTDHYADIPLEPEAIKHHAICMLGKQRSHRFGLYHKLSQVPSDKLVLTIQGANS